jgi:hypothetical protein
LQGYAPKLTRLIKLINDAQSEYDELRKKVPIDNRDIGFVSTSQSYVYTEEEVAEQQRADSYGRERKRMMDLQATLNNLRVQVDGLYGR